MKLNEIKQRCMKNRYFSIMNAPDGGQWLSDGFNAWRVCGIHVSKDVLEDLFGLTRKQAARCSFAEMDMQSDRFNGESYEGTEEQMRLLADVWAFDEKHLAMRCQSGLMFVPYSALKPVTFSEDTDFRARMDGEMPIIAVYNGIFCDALLSPVAHGKSEAIVQSLRSLTCVPVWRAIGGSEGAVMADASAVAAI